MPGAGDDAAGDGLSKGSTGRGDGAQAGLCLPHPIPKHEAGGGPGLRQRPGLHWAQ